MRHIVRLLGAIVTFRLEELLDRRLRGLLEALLAAFFLLAPRLLAIDLTTLAGTALAYDFALDHWTCFRTLARSDSNDAGLRFMVRAWLICFLILVLAVVLLGGADFTLLVLLFLQTQRIRRAAQPTDGASVAAEAARHLLWWPAFWIGGLLRAATGGAWDWTTHTATYFAVRAALELWDPFRGAVSREP